MASRLADAATGGVDERNPCGSFAAAIFRGPDPRTDGVSAWTRPDLCRWLETGFGKTYHPSSLTRVLRRMGLSRQKVRPVHPQADPRAQARFKKRGSTRR